MFLYVHDVPPWIVGTVTVALFVGASLAGLALTRGISNRRGLHALVDNGVIGWIFSAVLGIYAIAIGLMAVATWGNISEAEGIASREAAEIAALYRDLGGYPLPLRDKLQGTLASYTRYVIDEAWPRQRRGEIARNGGRILNVLAHEMYAFEPATDGQKIVHAEALHAFNALIELRRRRLEAVDYAVPGTLWSVILVGAALAIAASYVFNMESFWVHGLMTSLLAAMIALLVFFMLITDRPYRGKDGVGPDAYELVYRDVIAPDASR